MKTAEYVSPSHPDKICDQISDSILDEALRQDKSSRVAVEVMGGHGKIKITGEITTEANLNYEDIAKRVYKDYGYEDKVDVEVNVTSQSAEIKSGVDSGGAGDQGIMIGYACNENRFKIPQEHLIARSLIEFVYKNKRVDAKSQVTISGDRVNCIVVSAADIDTDSLKEMVNTWKRIDEPFIKRMNFEDCEIITNPAGDWSMSGFEADTGLTGRKVVVDSYGPRAPVGGGAFSGKDGTKVDRSGAYMARKIALSYLEDREAREVLVKLGYVIGKSEPIMKRVLIDGEEEEIIGFDLKPEDIIKNLGLEKPIYNDLARWGHFGRNGFSWEN